ncbi:MAG: 3-dehydroquinate synthase [Chitinispirillaceae bacterium]|nr:3-dehydroquinate synthase [Chitinispirillaceae bacterium]
MELTVSLGARSYPVHLDSGTAHAFPSTLKTLFPKSRFGLVTTTAISGLYKPLIDRWSTELDLTVHVIPDGERFKTIETWSKILDTFLAARFERSSVLIAFGGGVVGDVAGFAAATMLRGVTYVQVPTTLLAMVDSSVGGKTAVDHAAGKNLIGAFYQPRLVFIDTDFLNTLPEREYQAGYAELFKNAFIGAQGMFDFITRHHDSLCSHETNILLEGIKRSIEIKAAVVSRDECETSGERMLLNFGHTFAHALEKYFGFESLLHGEGVWYGMACAIELGKRLKTIPSADMPDYDLLSRKLLRPDLPSAPRIDDLYQAMFFDKKVSGQSIRFVVPEKKGTSVVKSNVPEDTVNEAVRSVLER